MGPCEAGDRTAGLQVPAGRQVVGKRDQLQVHPASRVGGVTGPTVLSPFGFDFGREKRCFEGTVTPELWSEVSKSEASGQRSGAAGPVGTPASHPIWNLCRRLQSTAPTGGRRASDRAHGFAPGGAPAGAPVGFAGLGH